MADLAVTERGQTVEDGFQFIQVGPHKLRIYQSNMDSSGPPLLICNGLGQAVEMLFPLIEELGQHPVIAFDAVGAGRSSVAGNRLSIQDHAVIVQAVLDQLGVTTYDVLGISWGGCIAQQLAHDDPQNCRNLILGVASAGGPTSWWGSPIAVSEILFPMRYLSKSYGNFIGPFMYGGEAILSPQLFRDYSQNSIRPSYDGYMAQVVAMSSWTSLPWLSRLQQKTLIFSGLYDSLIPAVNQALLAKQIPNATLKIFAAGHLLMYSRRKEVAMALLGFITD